MTTPRHPDRNQSPILYAPLAANNSSRANKKSQLSVKLISDPRAATGANEKIGFYTYSTVSLKYSESETIGQH